jgi:hypothetical protein
MKGLEWMNEWMNEWMKGVGLDWPLRHDLQWSIVIVAHLVVLTLHQFSRYTEAQRSCWEEVSSPSTDFWKNIKIKKWRKCAKYDQKLKLQWNLSNSDFTASKFVIITTFFSALRPWSYCWDQQDMTKEQCKRGTQTKISSFFKHGLNNA